ncbi:MAG: hypothetical protein COB49_01225 [Alphaproteobacteria bacterium]|nr:MAG: hypothetical protein COB49_01225 [Alphaproteobacteria bacterium]
MRRKATCASLLLTFLTSSVMALDFQTILTSQVAVGLNDGDLQKWDFTIKPEMTMDLSENLRLTAIGMARIEATDNLEPGRPDQFMRGALSKRGYIGDVAEIELREFYIDTSLDTPLGSAFLRLGKQQIVWGQADGLRVLDVVNPFNYREFILDEFEDRRIPLWSLNLEMPMGDVMTQFVWIPDQTYDQFPEPEAIFAIRSPRFIPPAPASGPVTLNEVNKPGDFIADSDVGLRLSAFMGGWDLTLNYLYHYQDRAVLFQTQYENGIAINPEYRRSHLIGGTFSNAFGSFTLRGEMGYSTDKYFLNQSSSNPNGIHKSGEFSYVLGLDYNGLQDSFISAQFFQSIITDFAQGIPRDKVDSQMTLLMDRAFMNDTLKVSFLLIQSLNDGDGVIELDMEYNLQDNITLSIGADIFYGNQIGLFGQFSQNDRLTFSIEIGF